MKITARTTTLRRDSINSNFLCCVETAGYILLLLCVFVLSWDDFASIGLVVIGRNRATRFTFAADLHRCVGCFVIR